MPCPEGCPCDCFDPRKQECLCALPENMIETFPASFLLGTSMMIMMSYFLKYQILIL